MAKPKLNLWLLNRVVDWRSKPLVDALSTKYDVSLGHRVKAGTQSPFPNVVSLPVNDPNGLEDGKPGELMHEGAALGKGQTTRYDEYFVPIPSKCFGDPKSAFWQTMAAPSASQRFTELDAHLTARFPNGAPSYAPNPTPSPNPAGAFFGPVQMNVAEAGLGYYEMLHRSSAANGGAMNVLVGYSQGGAVARYLAFLDEHVSKQRCIHGIVTVQSPNRGSPVASIEKRPEVSRALIAAMLSFPKWLPGTTDAWAVWRYLLAANANGGMLNFVNNLLDDLVRDWTAQEANAALIERWLTARKWLSGLSGVPDLAFYDLNPIELNNAGSVLHAIDSYPLRQVKHGAVIGIDNSLTDFVKQLISAWNGLAGFFADKLLTGVIERLVGEASTIYGVNGMSFPVGTPPVLMKQFETGIPGGLGLSHPIPERGHDFVIPSVSQLLVPYDPNVHLGHLVNDEASHVSGADGGPSSTGKTDEDDVVALLQRM